MSRFRKIKRKKTKKERFSEYVGIDQADPDKFVDDFIEFYMGDNLSREEAISEMISRGLIREG